MIGVGITGIIPRAMPWGGSGLTGSGTILTRKGIIEKASVHEIVV